MILAPTSCDAVPFVIYLICAGPVLALLSFCLAPVIVKCLLDRDCCACAVRRRVAPNPTSPVLPLTHDTSEPIVEYKHIFKTLPATIGRVLALGILYADLYVLFPPEKTLATIDIDSDSKSSLGLAEFLARCERDPLPPWYPVVHAIAEVLRRVLLIWFLYVVWNFTVQLLGLGFAMLEGQAAKTRSKVDDMIIPLLSEGVKRAWTLFFVVETMANLGLDMMTIIASLSLMSVAVAFAATDWIKNIFGVLVLIMNKPFEVGDIVTISGSCGTVEDITMRYVILVKFSGDQELIPTGAFLAANVNNISRRAKIQLKLRWDIAHDLTPCFEPQSVGAASTANAKVRKLREDLKAAVDADADFVGNYREVRLSLVPEGVRVDFECSFGRPEAWAAFCDKEAELVLTVRALMAAHCLRFASPIVQLADKPLQNAV